MGKSKGQRGPHFLDFNEKVLFQAPVKNCGNSPQSALDDHQNDSQNIINSVRGEGGKQENSPVPYQSFRNFCVPQEIPRTSAWPLPACLASPRERLSCSPRGASRGVGLPVGTRGLPMLGAGDLLPGGSRWSAKVVKHEKSSRSRGFMADLWEGVKVNEGHNSWTSGMKMLFQALVKHSLNSERGATKNDTILAST